MFDTAALARPLPAPAAPVFVNADTVRAHLARLAARGIGYKRAAELAGVTVESVRVIVAGRRGSRRGELPQAVRYHLAAALLRVLGDEPDPVLVPALGAQRRIQALACMGWSHSLLAARLGLNAGNFHRVLRQEQIRPTTHWAVVALFDTLWNVAPPEATPHEKAAVTRARAHARENGWHAPLAWDDIDNDEAPAEGEHVAVDELAVALAVDGENVRLTYAERRPAVAALNARRMTDPEIAERLGLNQDRVFLIRKDLRLPAVRDGEVPA